MRLREFIRQQKTLVEASEWSDKRMPKSGGKFPLSKARSFRVGASGWRWRVLSLDSGGRHFKVLVMYHAGKENYLAVVATPVGSDLLVLGRLENHSTHPGWHIHADCKAPRAADSGRLKYPSMRKVSSGAAKNEILPFPGDDAAAIEIATRYLKLPPLPDESGGQVAMTFPARGGP